MEHSSCQRKVIVYDCLSPSYIELVQELSEKNNWKPIHWFGSLTSQGKLIHEAFPEVTYHVKKDVIRGKLPQKLPVSDWPIRDVNVVRNFAKYDPVLFPVFLRQAVRMFGMDQMAEYHKVLTLWFHFFEHVSPQLLIYNKIPAHIYDYLPYLICKERGIPTLMLLKHHQVPNVVMPTNAFEEPAPGIKNTYDKLIETGEYKSIELSDEWNKLYQRMNGNYRQAMYKDFNRRYALDEKKDRVKLKDTISRKLFDVVTGKKSIFYGRALAREVLTMPRRWALRQYYNYHTNEPDYTSKYLFVPLHVQPERTSIPLGDVFGHQLLMIDILSRTLPDGWKIYIKEHPVQLYDRPVFKLFRTHHFYMEIMKYKNVELVPANISAQKMIDNSQAIAAVSSTTCWEALLRGKPVVVFGHNWFSFCEGVFYVSDERECKKVIRKIEAGVEVDQQKIKVFLYSIGELKENGILGSIDRDGKVLTNSLN